MRYATSRTVPGSIPGGVTGFFSDIFPSDRTMALRSTQHLVKMSTRNIPGSKGGRCVRLTTSPTSCAECYGNLGSLNLLEPCGPHRACYGKPLPLPFVLLFIFKEYQLYIYIYISLYWTNSCISLCKPKNMIEEEILCWKISFPLSSIAKLELWYACHKRYAKDHLLVSALTIKREHEQYRQCMCNLTMRGVRVMITVVQM